MNRLAGVGELLSRRAAAWTIVALTLGTLAFRCVGIDSMLPHQPEPDAVIVWQAAWLSGLPCVLPGGSSALPSFYPLLFAEILQWLPGSPVAVPLPVDAPLAEHLAVVAEPYLRARLLIVAISVLAIPAVYRIARAFLERGPAILAAIFAATSLLTTSYAQQARPHAASAAISAVAVALALRHARKGGSASFAAVSAVAALGLGAFQNGVFVLPTLLVAWWCAPRRSFAQLLWPIGFVALAVWRFYPFLFEPGVVDPRATELDIGGQVIALERISPVGFVRIVRGFLTFDPVTIVLGILGLVVVAVLLARRARIDRRALAVAAAFPATFVLFWGFMAHMFPRFTVPLVPFLSIAAAAGVVVLARAIAPTRAQFATFIVIGLASVALPAYASARLVAGRASTDTLAQAAQWIEAHGDPARDVIAHNVLLPLPLLRTRESLTRLPVWAVGPWEQYQRELADGGAIPRWNLVPVFRPGVFADRTIDLAEANSIVKDAGCTLGVALSGRARGAEFDQTIEALSALAAPPVSTIAAFDQGHADLDGSGYEFGFRGLERVLRARAWGPSIECYRLPPPESGR